MNLEIMRIQGFPPNSEQNHCRKKSVKGRQRTQSVPVCILCQNFKILSLSHSVHLESQSLRKLSDCSDPSCAKSSKSPEAQNHV